MNKREKEVIQLQLKAEEDVIKELEKQYKAALNEINQKVKLFQFDIDMLDEAINADGLDETAKAVLQSQKRSKIYQKQYQEALQGQVSGILERMQGNNYSTIESYLKQSYEDAYLGTMYDIQGQGIPLVMPIDQAAAVKAIMTDSKISKGLYNSLGVDVNGLKKAIRQEITRGIGTGLLYNEIARNIANRAKAPLSRAKVIVRTEGHRIQQQSADDARRGAISRGCDVVKQWDAALDGKTRDNHRRLDGQIREQDEPFEVAGKKAMFPGEFGDPAEDCNCRCVALTRARWALDEDELNTLKERAEYFGLDKTKDFEEYKDKFLNANEQIAKAEAAEHPVVNKYGQTIIFDEKMLSDEKWAGSVDLLKDLADEYNTRLTAVQVGSAVKAAGDVGMGGRMRLNSAKPDVTIHEFAHSIAMESLTKFGVEADDAFWKEIKAVRRMYKKDVGMDTTRWISFYEHSNKSIDEFLAEAFTQAKAKQLGLSLPDYYGNDLTYSNKVLDIVNKYFKKPLENSANGDRIILRKSKSTVFNSMADPLADVFGSGEISHPKEVATFRDELKKLGVELKEHDKESLGYIPGLVKGTPGTAYISKNASFGAWSHEMQHVYDDRDAGWVGMSIIADPDERYSWEVKAYDIEINMALEAGRPDIADRLRENLEEERRKIYGE